MGTTVAAVALIAVVVRSFDDTFDGWYDTLREDSVLVIMVGLPGIAAAIALRGAGRPRVAAVSAVLVATVVTVLALAPARYIGIGQTGEFVGFAKADVRAYEQRTS